MTSAASGPIAVRCSNCTSMMTSRLRGSDVFNNLFYAQETCNACHNRTQEMVRT
jgi:hypothetical protein